MLKELNKIFDKKDRKVVAISIAFSLVVSITEVFGISMLFPFMGVVSNPKNIEKNKYLKYVYENLAKENYKNFVLYFGIGIIGIFILKTTVALAFNYYSTVVARKLNRKYSNKLFQTYLDFEYKSYTQKNRSEFIRIVTQECSLLVQIFQNIANLISEVCIMLLLYVMMLYVNWKLTLMMTLFLMGNILIIKLLVLKTSKKLGKVREGRSKEFYQIVNSVFSNYKFIKLQGNNKSLEYEYNKALKKTDELQVKQSILTPIPKSMLEFSGFFMIVSIVLFSIMNYGEEAMIEILPIVSLFFLSLYRMLPSIIRIVGIFQGFAFMSPVPGRIREELSYEVENLGDKKIEFNEKIELQGLKFEYKRSNPILNDVSIYINKGESVAFIGESGSGKTTLVDVLMGLYKPLNGDIFVDGKKLDRENLKSWRDKIGYIPQEIYLFDGTIGENVAFGSQYNEERIIEVLKKSKIWKFLKEKDGVNTRVGDAGVMLSGGQKQRVGIARALYKDPEILVLDEATSALDDSTEEDIMSEIYNLSVEKTLIMIAHRLTSLTRCNRIYELEKGEVKNEYFDIGEVM